MQPKTLISAIHLISVGTVGYSGQEAIMSVVMNEDDSTNEASILKCWLQQ